MMNFFVTFGPFFPPFFYIIMSLAYSLRYVMRIGKEKYVQLKYGGRRTVATGAIFEYDLRDAKRWLSCASSLMMVIKVYVGRK
jgi:hypothetical protein